VAFFLADEQDGERNSLLKKAMGPNPASRTPVTATWI
jgi:hypothetical protein